MINLDLFKDTNLFVSNEFLNKYIELVNQAKVRLVQCTKPMYKHHIIQKAFYKLLHLPINNSEENLVTLTFYEHCLAHYYLYKCTTEELQQANAYALTLMIKAKTKLNILSEAEIIELISYADSIIEELNPNKLWTPEEDDILIANYQKGITTVYELLPDRSINGIRYRALKLGLKSAYYWTSSEKEILLANYAALGKQICELLPNKTWSEIMQQAHYCDLKIEKVGWTDEELFILKTNYKNKTYSELAALLPNRKESTIRKKISNLGLKKVVQIVEDHNKKWTAEEIELLMKYYPILGIKVAEFLPGRSKQAIQSYANKKLKLKKQI